jgi:hypothetical protein
MIGHGAKFEQKMEQAIAALLSHRSIEDAAHEVGISPNTLVRWMKEPEFRAACQEARRTVFSHAIGRLQDAAGAAATTLLKIMLDPTAPAPTRLRAAEVVLEQAAKAGEIEGIEDRVAKLECAAGLVRKPQKSSSDLTWLSATYLPDAAATPARIEAPRLDSSETGEDDIE